MDVRNCRVCRKIFNYVSGPNVCPSCREELEKKFQEVKKYILEHKGCSIPEVAENCDVEVAQIRQWLREERLEFSSESQIQLNCERCGVSINSGRYCEKCKNEMANSLNTAFARPSAPAAPAKKDTKDSPKMRFLQ